MTDHPSTYSADDTFRDGVQWDDRASLHIAHDGQGIFDSMKGLRRGSLAELVAQVASMPAEERGKYVIQKAGDHKLGSAEIMALASRDDFPLK